MKCNKSISFEFFQFKTPKKIHLHEQLKRQRKRVRKNRKKANKTDRFFSFKFKMTKAALKRKWTVLEDFVNFLLKMLMLIDPKLLKILRLYR